MRWRIPWLERRLAWRLCLLFVAGALVPVAMSDWLAITVVGEIGERLNHERRGEAVHVASRQVLDRLKISEALLQSLAGSLPNEGRPVLALPRSGTTAVFDRLGCWQVVGDADSAGDAVLRALWDEATLHAMPQAGPHAMLATADEDPIRILMGARAPDGRTCVAMLSADYLWAPLRHGADDASWMVRDARGRVLASMRGDDADAADRAGRPREDYTARLFMVGEFGAPDWTFVQSAPLAPVEWHRQPLVTWLVAVASATLLAVGLVGQRRIRRTLQPLEQLTAGTRRLARGQADTRVDVRREDEVGVLAQAFNEMADELQARGHRLMHLAAHDDLTGLMNRYGLHQALSERLASPGRSLAVVFIDLDHFKDVNDRHGHAVGDAVLRLAAERLRGVAGERALLARKGGDEFVLVLPGTDDAQAVAAQAIAALALPFQLAGAEHACGASAGIALCPAHGEAMEELLRCADIALYESKNAGRGRVTLFDPAQDRALRERADLLAALHLAVERGEWAVHYQPRLAASDGTLVGAEALVRWQRPGAGLVPPSAFIELAE
ncbi:MAG TPA: diguanylate cyclase, partial [Burkholderiaceae bacterium]